MFSVVTVCESQQYFLDGACYSKCPAGYYESNCTFQLSINSTSNSTFTAAVCRPCITGCMSCERHDPDHCTLCLTTHHLSSTGKCKLLVPINSKSDKANSSKVPLLLHGIDPILAAIVLCFVFLLVFVLIFLLLQCRERLKSCLCCCCYNGYNDGLDIRGKYQRGGRDGEFVDVIHIDRQTEESYSLLDSNDEDDMSVEDSVYSSRQIGTAHMPDYLMNLATGK